MSIHTMATLEIVARSKAPFVGTMAKIKLACAEGEYDCVLSGPEAESALAAAGAGVDIPVEIVTHEIVAGGELLAYEQAIPDFAAARLPVPTEAALV